VGVSGQGGGYGEGLARGTSSIRHTSGRCGAPSGSHSLLREQSCLMDMSVAAVAWSWQHAHVGWGGEDL